MAGTAVALHGRPAMGGPGSGAREHDAETSRCPSAATPCRSRRGAWPSRPTAPCSCGSGDTVVLATACAQKEPRAGVDFLPLTVDYRENTYAGGQDPRRLLQARGPAEREGDPDLAHDRPPAAAALPRGLRLRDPGHRPAALGRHGERLRHAGHHRRLDRALHLRHPVRQPGRRGARRLLGRAVRGEPDHRRPARRRASSTCWWPAPRTRS